MAVPVDEFPQRSKSIARTRLKPVILSFINDEDISHIAHGFDSKSLRKNRLKRWVDQAFDQGALLTQLDLAVMLSLVSICRKFRKKGICCLQEVTFTISLVPLLTKEKSLLFTCKVILLLISLLRLITLKKLLIVTSKTITELKFFGSTILKIQTKYHSFPGYLNVLCSSILIFYQLN